MSRKSNPVSYRLKPAETLRDLDRRITQTRQIFAGYRKQARVAYIHRREAIKNQLMVKFIHNDEALQAGITAFRNLWDKEARKLEELFAECESKITVYIQRLFTYEDWSDKEKVSTFNTNVDRLNTEIRFPRVNMACGLETFQKEAYHSERILSKGKKEHADLHTKIPDITLKADVFKGLKQQYPYISSKNKTRLIRLYLAWWQVVGRFPRTAEILPIQLVEAGIPAAEVVGPWFVRTKDIKGPMDWVKRYGVKRGPDGGLGMTRAPLITHWLMGIGLDQHDRQLADSVSLYYRQHKAPPSVEWARRRNNEIEEDRTKAELETKVPVVDDWLEESQYWRRGQNTGNDDVVTPPMPDPTFRILGPGEGETLCRMAKKEGLCVVDVLTDIMDQAGMYADEDRTSRSIYKKSCAEGVVTLIISTDSKRRTVVGLNQAGICTSEHHCTGIQNKVDKVAYDYFRKPHDQF